MTIMLSLVISRIIILCAGVVYPAYSSYKSVKEKNVRGYVKWLMYWVVFALFASIESITDMFVAWIPFYYEMKILILLWLVSPVSRGSIRFYVRCLHPLLLKRENEIDMCLSHLTDLLYFTVVKLFGYIFGLVRSSLSVGHTVILEQIKLKYGLQEVKTDEPQETDKTETENPAEPLNTNISAVKSEDVDKMDSQEPVTTKSTTLTTETAETTVTTTPSATATTTPVSRSYSSSTDSRYLTSDRRKPLPPSDLSFYGKYTRQSYSTGLSSSYGSSYTGSSLTNTGSSLYDRYARPTTSSSRYSSSTWSPKTSTYSSRYSKK